MRHRIKNTYSVQKDAACGANPSGKILTDQYQLNIKATKSHFLRSDKGTCFYSLSRKLSLKRFFKRKQIASNPANELRKGPLTTHVGREELFAGKIIPLGLPTMSSFALLLMCGSLIFPTANSAEKVSAAPAEIDFGSSRKVSLSILNDTGTELADDATVTTNIETPGTVSYISSTIRVNTSKIAKYYVGVQAADGSSNLLTGTTYTEETISGVGDNVSPNEFGDNTWGYNLTSNTTVANNSLTYSTLPTYNANTTFQYTSDTNPTDGNHDLKLIFAAKINANKPADHYTTRAMVSVAADPKALFDGITTMQEMTSTICTNASENDSKQLKDVRDSKTYWVAKLKDGNCWMTQNLDLDLYVNGAGRKLTQNDSNVPEAGWTSTTGASALWSTSGNNDVKYYDPGYKTMANGSGSPANATEALAKDTTGQINAHYLQGNYYSWVAANAGDTRTSGSSTKDICPKGWQLPLSNSGTNAKTFQALTNALGATSGTSTGSSDSKLLTSPGYFVRGGVVYSGNVNDLRSSGYYWPATAYSSSLSYNLYFDSRNVYPSSNNSRYYGMSVRCVAK